MHGPGTEDRPGGRSAVNETASPGAGEDAAKSMGLTGQGKELESDSKCSEVLLQTGQRGAPMALARPPWEEATRL